MDNLKGNRTEASVSSVYNQLEFLIQNTIKNTVNTAIPVRVVAVQAGERAGYVDVLPLIESYDGFGNAIPSQTIFKIPYMRVQGGIAALIIDPVVGDIGLAVFSQQDSTNLSDSPKKPFSRRCFSMADGFYIGGFLNQKPSIYLELKQDNTANLICPTSLRVQTKDMTIDCSALNINASQAVNLNTPLTTIAGNLATGGSGGGSVSINGNMTVSNDVTASGISLKNHVHTENGQGADTSTPH